MKLTRFDLLRLRTNWILIGICVLWNHSAQAMEISQKNTQVQFSVVNFLITTARGEFKKFSGTVDLKTPFEKSTFNSAIEVESIDTSEPSRDEHLLTADYFNAKQYPKIIFTSTRIEGTEDHFKILGQLTIKGTTLPVTLNASITNTHPKKVMAETKINRQDFGIKAGPSIKNEVTLKVETTLD